MNADNDFSRYGTSLRIEATFLLVWNEKDHENLGVMKSKFRLTNKKYSTWAHRIMGEFGRQVPVEVFPRIITANHEILYSIIFNTIMAKRKGATITARQRELVSLIERMILFNITGDNRAIGDNAFTKLKIRNGFFERGIINHCRVYFYVLH